MTEMTANDTTGAHATMPRSLDVLVPFWGLAGGVIKVLDYAEHAVEHGLTVRLWAPPLPEDRHPIHSLPVLQRLRAAHTADFNDLDALAISTDATVLFTDPTHHGMIERALADSLGPRLIHLVQGTRHANPRWQDGCNYRLLHRPMTRITVSDAVTEAIIPIVNNRFPLHTIVEGHDVNYFAGRPHSSPRPDASMRVMYTRWKSSLGDRVRERFEQRANADSVAWTIVSTPLGWPALRNRYHGADIFLCTPGPEEGFYLPGLEAMASGAAVITALVGGNSSYIRDEQNALVATYEDVDDHVAAIERLVRAPEVRSAIVERAYDTVQSHSLVREREEFAKVLSSVTGR